MNTVSSQLLNSMTSKLKSHIKRFIKIQADFQLQWLYIIYLHAYIPKLEKLIGQHRGDGLLLFSL